MSAKRVVLVVDDEPLILLDGMCTFEDAGFEAIPAANAAEAICVLEERDDIRVVITDIGMPGTMDGVKLCAAIRERWPAIELIITSGQHTPAADELPSRSIFLQKPCDGPRLLDALRKFAADVSAH